MAEAIAIAYAYLNHRERTVAEVRARLAQAVERDQCSTEESEAALAELLELGYLDDARYARLFIEDKRTLQSWGTERIQRDLVERGIERETVAAALAELAMGEGTSELDRALELLRQRYPEPASEPRERERAYGMLVRKGYDSDVAGDAVRAWMRG